MNKTLTCVVALLLALVMLPAAAFAAGPIDTDREVTMGISYSDDGKPLAGAQFAIYQVATVSQTGELSVTEAFEQFPVDIKGKDDAAWKKLASTLEGYVLRDGVVPADSGITDDAGNLTFPTGETKLEQGLYLVLGQRHTQDGYYYDASPFMVMLPAQDIENNEWLYEVAVSPKFDCTKVPDEETTVTRKVLKVWDDEGSEAIRPTEVVVQLLRDGEVYDTVTLSADTDWRHTWTELEDDHAWTVVEKGLDGYTATVTREGITFVLTNTYSSVEPSGDTVERTVSKVWDDKGYESKRPISVQVSLLQDGAVYDTQVLSADNGWRYTWGELPKYDAGGNEIAWSLSEAYVPGYTSTVSCNGQVFELTNTFNDQNLPQTGALWWPVPLLVCGGLVFIIAGVVAGRAKRGHDEAR